MIKRLVKMQFRAEEVKTFLELFETVKQQIRAQPGCHHLALWQDEADPSVLFTYSIWQSVDHLDVYRQTDFFKDTWSRTKALFARGPEAWSVRELEANVI